MAKRAEAAGKHPGGRPSKYDPAYCEQIVAFCADGYSITAFAGHIDVARSTIQEWEAQHPEFSVAVSRAKAVRLLHWERAALNVATRGGGPGTATIIVFGLKNMGGDEWTDTTKTELSGPGGGPVRNETTTKLDLSGMAQDDRDALRAILGRRLEGPGGGPPGA